jgi:microcystin-dependent protein
MADPFIAEIRIFALKFAPKNWAWCDGQLLPISQNTALFSILGTTYGGNGQTTFALPDLRDRAALHPGQGPGLSSYVLGQVGGTEAVTLGISEMPFHTHSVMANTNPSNLAAPSPMRSFARSAPSNAYHAQTPNLTPFAQQAIMPTGLDTPHNNLQPYLTLYFCIALDGMFPSRN